MYKYVQIRIKYQTKLPFPGIAPVLHAETLKSGGGLREKKLVHFTTETPQDWNLQI
jgi:hypothetical protein